MQQIIVVMKQMRGILLTQESVPVFTLQNVQL